MRKLKQRIKEKLKDKQEKKTFAMQLLILKKIISLYAEQSVKTILYLKLKELTTAIPEISFELLAYLTEKIPNNIIKNEELLMRLASSFSIEGLDTDAKLDNEELAKFIDSLSTLMTIDYIKEVAEGYNREEHTLEKVLEGSKIITSVDLGESYQVVNK